MIHVRAWPEDRQRIPRSVRSHDTVLYRRLVGGQALQVPLADVGSPRGTQRCSLGVTGTLGEKLGTVREEVTLDGSSRNSLLGPR
jgi:hypothetical protein